MSLTRVDILVVVAAIGIVVFVALLPSPRDNNPAVPDTAAHRGLPSERDCLRCHAAGAAQALPALHPSRTDCFRCHRVSESNLSKPGKLGKLGRAHVRTVAMGLRPTLYDEKPKRRSCAILWRHSTGSMRCCRSTGSRP